MGLLGGDALRVVLGAMEMRVWLRIAAGGEEEKRKSAGVGSGRWVKYQSGGGSAAFQITRAKPRWEGHSQL
jgi:hypothetical protein